MSLQRCWRQHHFNLFICNNNNNNNYSQSQARTQTSAALWHESSVYSDGCYGTNRHIIVAELLRRLLHLYVCVCVCVCVCVWRLSESAPVSSSPGEVGSEARHRGGHEALRRMASTLQASDDRRLQSNTLVNICPIPIPIAIPVTIFLFISHVFRGIWKKTHGLEKGRPWGLDSNPHTYPIAAEKPMGIPTKSPYPYLTEARI